MPPAVCQDSEDDDDDIFNVNNDVPSQESTHSWVVREAEAFLTQSPGSQSNIMEGPKPPGTTSSELLRDVVTAQRGLFGTAPETPNAPELPSSTSPALQRKRRQTVVAESGVAVSSSVRKLKRAKTTNPKTYGSETAKALSPDEDDNWAAIRDEETGAAPTSETAAPTSETAQFSDHSEGHGAETGLAAGSLQQNFMDHEPAVMFRDTGSTVAYNESSEQRLVEQALVGSGKQAREVPNAEMAQSEKHDSSPFPHSASTKLTQSQKVDQSTTRDQDEAASESTQNGISVHGQNDQRLENQDPDVHESIAVGEHSANTKRSVPKSSPVVQIPRQVAVSAMSPDVITVGAKNETSQKKARGRRRKTQESSDEPVELLNSDEREIGQPRENYKPRPSRRRATEIVQDNIDFSVVPERAAKKRRKTATASLASLESQPMADKSAPKSSEQEDHTPANGTADTRLEQLPMPDANAGDDRRPNENPEKQSAVESNKVVERGDTPASLKSSQGAIAMPPPSLPASTTKKKARRSHTTIFEDHVSPAALRKSPSLSQQQASRQSALQELPLSSTQRKGKKSRTIIDSDEDDEDELAKEDASAQETVVPKKRGRPAKAAVEKKAKSSEKVVEDSDTAEDDNFEEDVAEEEPPKKKGRGRPKKGKPVEEPKPTEAVKIASSDMSAVENATECSPAKAALQRKDANQQLTTETSKAATPSPSPQKGPVSHSPIKSQSAVSYRVGLSKRSRIPSLLKTFRPPPKQSTR